MHRYLGDSWAAKIVSVGMLSVFFVVLSLSLFHMAHTMDMDAGMAGCPFMSSTDVVCDMGVAEHLASWKALSLAAPLVLLVVLIIPFCARILELHLSRLFGQLLPLEYAYATTAYQDIPRKPFVNELTLLFADGILHPKLF